MSDQPETLAAILADYRADIPAMTIGEMPHPTPEYLRILLDRIEAAVKREMDEAAEFIDDYLNEIPVYHPPHDWLIRNGYKDTSYQNDIFEDQNDGGAPAPDGAERDADGDTK